MKFVSLLVYLLFFSFNTVKAQNIDPCNTESPWVNGSTYSNLSAQINDNVTCFLCPCLGGVSNVGNMIDANLNNWAQIDMTGIGCDATIGVFTNGSETYPAGTWAGFNIGTEGLLSGVTIGASVTIYTYNNGVIKETFDAGAQLSSLNTGLSVGSRYSVGFVTTQPFDELRIKYAALSGVLFVAKVYHPVLIKFCGGSTPTCNTPTALAQPTYPAFISSAGVTGLTLGSVSNVGNVVNSNTSDAATIALPVGILSTGYISVKDYVTDYPAGYFAGFEYQNPVLIGADLLNSVQIKTYLNGVLQETSTNGTLIAAESSLLNGTGRQIAGFVTTRPFNTVQITVSQGLSVNLGTTQVFRAVIQQFCAAPPLVCNTPTNVTLPTYPLSINNILTGTEGIACIGCNVNNSNNVINSNVSDYAEIVLLAGVGTTGSISVKDAITTYAAGTFAGFDISNPNLLNVNFLGNTTIQLYNNGTLVQSGSGSSQLLSANSGLITGSDRGVVGIVANVPFDEVRIRFLNTVSLSLGTIRVYSMVLQKGCAGDLDCDSSHVLTLPDYPVVIEGSRTGIGSGLACVGCIVDNPYHVIDNDSATYARINLVAGVLFTNGSIAVRDLATTYPAQTVVGFVVRDPNSILEVGLLNAITIRTYLNGTLQETATGGGSLIDFNLIVPWLGGGSGLRSIGFKTTQPFNEVRITYTLIVGSVLTFLDVYNAFIDTRFVTDTNFNCCPTVAPVLSTHLSPICPSSTINLNSLVTSVTPANATLVWFNGPNPATSTPVATPTAIATAGMYYAFYYNNTSPNNCYSPSSTVEVKVQSSLSANVTAVSQICAGQNAVFTITGTDGTTVTYTIDGGANQITTSTATLVGGTATVTLTGANTNQTLNLVSMVNPTTNCTQTLSGTATVIVNATPNTPSVIGPLSNVCPDTTVNLITVSSALTPSVAGGVFEWRVGSSPNAALVSTPTSIGAGTYYLFEKSPANCYSAGAGTHVTLNTCCPDSECFQILIRRANRN
ncbi:MAG: hypothetical protein JNL70_21595 [Saprospiraceae bacterium]|nr:hypothetical protein [Saprospiraceae bacterium]